MFKKFTVGVLLFQFLSASIFSMETNNSNNTVLNSDPYSVARIETVFLNKDEYREWRAPLVKFLARYADPITKHKGEELLWKLVTDDSFAPVSHVHPLARIIGAKTILKYGKETNTNSLFFDKEKIILQKLSSFNDPLAHYYLAEYYEKMGDPRSVEHFKNAYKISSLNSNMLLFDWSIIKKLLLNSPQKDAQSIFKEVVTQTQPDDLGLMRLIGLKNYASLKQATKEKKIQNKIRTLESNAARILKISTQNRAIELADLLKKTKNLRPEEYYFLRRTYEDTSDFEELFKLAKHQLTKINSVLSALHMLKDLSDSTTCSTIIKNKAQKELLKYELFRNENPHPDYAWYLFQQLDSPSLFLCKKKLLNRFIELLQTNKKNKYLYRLGQRLVDEAETANKKSSILIQKGIEIFESLAPHIPIAYGNSALHYLEQAKTDYSKRADARQYLQMLLSHKINKPAQHKTLIGNILHAANECSHDDAEISHLLWSVYQKGWATVEPDFQLSKKFHEVAANLGHPMHVAMRAERAKCKTELNNLFNLIGEGTEEHFQISKMVGKLDLEQDASIQQIRLLLSFWHIKSVNGDPQKGIEYFKKSIMLGSMYSQCQKELENALAALSELSKKDANAMCALLEHHYHELYQKKEIDLANERKFADSIIQSTSKLPEIQELSNKIGTFFINAGKRLFASGHSDARKYFEIAQIYGSQLAECYSKLAILHLHSTVPRADVATQIVRTLCKNNLAIEEFVEIYNSVVHSRGFIQWQELLKNDPELKNQIGKMIIDGLDKAPIHTLQFIEQSKLYDVFKEVIEPSVSAHYLGSPSIFFRVLGASAQSDWQGILAVYQNDLNNILMYPYVIEAQMKLHSELLNQEGSRFTQQAFELSKKYFNHIKKQPIEKLSDPVVKASINKQIMNFQLLFAYPEGLKCLIEMCDVLFRFQKDGSLIVDLESAIVNVVGSANNKLSKLQSATGDPQASKELEAAKQEGMQITNIISEHYQLIKEILLSKEREPKKITYLTLATLAHRISSTTNDKRRIISLSNDMIDYSKKGQELIKKELSNKERGEEIDEAMAFNYFITNGFSAILSQLSGNKEEIAKYAIEMLTYLEHCVFIHGDPHNALKIIGNLALDMPKQKEVVNQLLKSSQTMNPFLMTFFGALHLSNNQVIINLDDGRQWQMALERDRTTGIELLKKAVKEHGYWISGKILTGDHLDNILVAQTKKPYLKKTYMQLYENYAQESFNAGFKNAIVDKAIIHMLKHEDDQAFAVLQSEKDLDGLFELTRKVLLSNAIATLQSKTQDKELIRDLLIDVLSSKNLIENMSAQAFVSDSLFTLCKNLRNHMKEEAKNNVLAEFLSLELEYYSKVYNPQYKYASLQQLNDEYRSLRSDKNLGLLANLALAEHALLEIKINTDEDAKHTTLKNKYFGHLLAVQILLEKMVISNDQLAKLTTAYLKRGCELLQFIKQKNALDSKSIDHFQKMLETIQATFNKQMSNNNNAQ